MASEDPKCPDCEGPIGADWDWCLHCGYDPDHLKPWDWRPQSGQVQADQMSGSVQTAIKPGKVGLIDLTDRKRRSKRKNRTRKGEQTEPKVATMASTSSLIVLPTRPADPTPRSAPIPPAPGRVASAPPTAPVAAPAPPAPAASAPVASAPVVDRPMPSRPAPAPTRPAPAPVARPIVAEPVAAPKFDMTSPLASPMATTPNRVEPTRVLTLPRSTLGMVPSFVLFALGALMLYAALSSMSRLGHGDVLSRATTVLFILVCLALACGMAAQGYAFMKVRVEVSPDEVIAHNRFGRPSTARIRDIFSVKMGSRRYLDVPFLGRAAETPYVQMQDGSGFWIDALEGRAGEPPTPDQQVVIDALARTVASNRSESLQDERPSGLI